MTSLYRNLKWISIRFLYLIFKISNMKISYSIILLFIFTLISCSSPSEKTPTLGVYMAEMSVKDGSILPFKFELSKDEQQLVMKVDNDKETLFYNDITIQGDSIRIAMPPFDAVIIAKIESGELIGRYLKEESNRSTSFYAFLSDAPKFESSKQANFDISGNYKTEFRPERPYPGLGIFSQEGNKVSGTFRKNSGDNRFLSGVVSGDSLYLSTFDGAHPYLVKAVKKGDTIFGNLYYESHSLTEFWMIQDENYELAESKELTKLKDGYESIDFSFKDHRGKTVSLSDEQFENKVVVVQILGTWCPNCLDETKFFLSYIKENPNLDLAFVGLSFESARTEERAMNRIEMMVDKLEIPYPVLLAQYGSTDTKLAQEKLPMLDKVRSYPTMIVIDKSGKVNSIHTGFNGPATGQAYEDFKEEFDLEIKSLLNE